MILHSVKIVERQVAAVLVKLTWLSLVLMLRNSTNILIMFSTCKFLLVLMVIVSLGAVFTFV